MGVLAQPHALGHTTHQFTDTLHNRDSHSQTSCTKTQSPMRSDPRASGDHELCKLACLHSNEFEVCLIHSMTIKFYNS